MSGVSPLRRQYAKLCEIGDFRDGDILRAIRSLVPERDPLQYIERKVWEFALLMLFLEETGHLDGRSEMLSVGAGDERVLFWLTNRVGRMVATDIYGEGRFAGQEAKATMLSNPAAHAPVQYGWRPERLEVYKMDGRSLEFPDSSFDAVFTISSIEHFGSHSDIARAAREIGRVLRPGGHAFIVTEYLVRRHPLNAAWVDYAVRLATLGRRSRTTSPRRRRMALGEAFTRRELQRYIVRASGLAPMQSLDTTLSPESWHNITTMHPDGSLCSETGNKYPQIMLRYSRSAYTSVCLPMVKPHQ